MFIGAVALVTGLTSCSEFSKDDPLPIPYKQTLFVGSNNQIVYAIDPISGSTKWKFSAESEIQATPLVYRDYVYIATVGGKVHKISCKSGAEDRVRSFDGAIIATPLVYNNIIFICAGSTVYSIKPDDLQNRDVPDTENPIYTANGPIIASPTVNNVDGIDGPVLFVATMSNQVAAVNITTSMQQVWTYGPSGAGAFYSSPCVVNSKYLYIGNDNGNVYALNTIDGTEKWAFKTDGQVRSSPIQKGGNVMVGSNDRYFYSVDSATGLLRWRVKTQDVIQSSPSVFDQNVYFGSYDGNLYCIDIIDGTVKWKMLTGALIKSSPLLYRGDVYFGGYDKNLYRLDAYTGAQKSNPVNIHGQMFCSPVIDSVGGAAVPSISGNYRY